MKKIFFVLLIAGIAISANAFTNKTGKNLGYVIYFQENDDIWKPLVTNLSTLCAIGDKDPCLFLFYDDTILRDYPVFSKDELKYNDILDIYNGEGLTSRARSKF